jgi:hypothetical protein
MLHRYFLQRSPGPLLSSCRGWLRLCCPEFDERGIHAARGGKWSAVKVARLLGAAGIPFGGSIPGGASVGAL